MMNIAYWWPLMLLGLIFCVLQLLPIIWDRFGAAPQQEEQELDTLRFAALHPYPCWELDQYGVISWSNEAADGIGAPFLHRAYTAYYSDPDAAHYRVLTDAGSDLFAMDVVSVPTEEGVYLSAYPADQVERSDASHRASIRTLANTFSHLSIGLVVFDLQQKLSTFNPAVLELTGLPFEALSKGPDIQSFLDSLRDAGVLQEPRNYAKWRSAFVRAIADPERANPAETWAQADGRTIRLTPKPHEDGSVALLLEDVTDPTETVRQLRQQIDHAHCMLDNSDVPQILFDLTGKAIYANAPYRAFWSHNPNTDDAATTLHACCRLWQAKSQPDPNWARLARLGAHLTPDKQQEFEIDAEGGRSLEVKCTMLPGQVTAIKFIETGASNKRYDADVQMRA